MIKVQESGSGRKCLKKNAKQLFLQFINLALKV